MGKEKQIGAIDLNRPRAVRENPALTPSRNTESEMPYKVRNSSTALGMTNTDAPQPSPLSETSEREDPSRA